MAIDTQDTVRDIAFYNLDKYNKELEAFFEAQLELLSGKNTEIKKPHRFWMWLSTKPLIRQLSPYKSRVALYNIQEAINEMQDNIEQSLDNIQVAINKGHADLPEKIANFAEDLNNEIDGLKMLSSKQALGGLWSYRARNRVDKVFNNIFNSKVIPRYYEAAYISLADKYEGLLKAADTLNDANNCDSTSKWINTLSQGFGKLSTLGSRYISSKAEDITALIQGAGVAITKLNEKKNRLLSQSSANIANIVIPPKPTSSPSSINTTSPKARFVEQVASGLEAFFKKKQDRAPVVTLRQKFTNNKEVNYYIEQAYQALSINNPITINDQHKLQCARDLADALSKKQQIKLTENAAWLRTKLDESGVSEKFKDKVDLQMASETAKIQKKYREFKQLADTNSLNKKDIVHLEHKISVALEIACRLSDMSLEKLHEKSGNGKSLYKKFIDAQSKHSRNSKSTNKKTADDAIASLATLNKNSLFVVCNLDAQVRALKNMLPEGHKPSYPESFESNEIPDRCILQ